MAVLDRLCRLLFAGIAGAACAAEPAPRIELVADPPEVPLAAVPPPAPPAPPPSVSASATPPAASSAPADGPLSDELALLEAAYNAVRGAGLVAPRRTPELDEAAKLLNRYEKEFPQGLLRQEAQMLRVEVAYFRGDVARARALATRFVAEYPQSPGALRMQRFLQYPLPCTGNSHPDPKAPYCCVWPEGQACSYP